MTAEFVRRAMLAFPGTREIRSGYCEACGSRFGRWSDELGAVLCDGCWRPRFYGGDLEVAHRARGRR
jgi:hypothetical protein